MIVDVDRLEAIRPVGQLKGLDHALEAVVGAMPEIRVDVLVLVGREDLEGTVGLVHADRRDRGPGRVAARDQRIAAVHVEHAGLVGQLDGFGGRLAVA